MIAVFDVHPIKRCKQWLVLPSACSLFQLEMFGASLLIVVCVQHQRNVKSGLIPQADHILHVLTTQIHLGKIIFSTP